MGFDRAVVHGRHGRRPALFTEDAVGDEMVHGFLVESRENLDERDRDLRELEQQPGSRELFSGIRTPRSRRTRRSA